VEAKGLNTETSEEYTIELDKSIRESGVQGGKIIGEKLAVGSFIIGIPFFIMGVYALCSMVFGLGFPTNTAALIAAALVTVMGVLLMIGGYSLYRTKQVNK